MLIRYIFTIYSSDHKDNLKRVRLLLKSLIIRRSLKLGNHKKKLGNS